MQEDSPTSNRYSPPSLFTTCPRYSSLNLLLKRSQQLLEDSGGQVCRVQEDNPTSPVAFRSWEDICQSKDNGGLGIRDLHTVNKSLIIRNAYDIATNKNPLLTAVLKSKYFHTSSFWTANRYGPKSIFWSSILQVKKDLTDNATYQLHAGNASIWSTPWCPVWDTIHDHLLLPVTTMPLPAIASHLWVPNSQTWNVPLLTNTFDNAAVQAIASVRPVPSNQQDILRWTPTKNGICTTKAIYRHLATQNTIQLPQQGSRSILPQANQILTRAWKTKQLPPIIKAFTWRIIRRALSTAERAARFSNHIDDHCATCGAMEDDAHLFFQCQLPRVV